METILILDHWEFSHPFYYLILMAEYCYFHCEGNEISISQDNLAKATVTNNSQIPIQKYGKLEISSSEGLNEVFMISNASITRYFCDNMNDFIKLLNQMNWNVKMTENKDGTAVKDI